MSGSLQLHGLYSPRNSPSQNTGLGSRSLLQGIFPTQVSNRGLLQCKRILYQLSYQGSDTEYFSPKTNQIIQSNICFHCLVKRACLIRILWLPVLRKERKLITVHQIKTKSSDFRVEKDYHE